MIYRVARARGFTHTHVRSFWQASKVGTAQTGACALHTLDTLADGPHTQSPFTQKSAWLAVHAMPPFGAGQGGFDAGCAWGVASVAVSVISEKLKAAITGIAAINEIILFIFPATLFPQYRQVCLRMQHSGN